jgi:hypothetical protein
MPLQQLRNCNFGTNRTGALGASGVGYQLIDEAGSISAARTTVGVYEPAPGIYSAYITFPDGFRGQVLWDTGAYFAKTLYAVEQYNEEENSPFVSTILNTVTQMSGTLASLYDIQYGRWQIVGNQMIFYKDDNSTVVARFNLFDDMGAPTMDAVFDRVKV